MTRTLYYQCECGKMYDIFVPEEKLFGMLFIIPDKLKTLLQIFDEADLKAGSFKQSTIFSKEQNDDFLDARETSIFSCSCGKIIDIVAVCEYLLASKAKETS